MSNRARPLPERAEPVSPEGVAVVLRVPAGRTPAPSVQRGLGLCRAAATVRAACRWGRERAGHAVAAVRDGCTAAYASSAAVLRRPLRSRRRPARARAIERLESRIVLSVVWSAGDGVFVWQDGKAHTQALDVTQGDVELHFSDDVANSGDLTEIRLLSNNTGFQVTTTDIDLVRTDPGGKTSWHAGGLDVGVDVGPYTADTTGTVDRIDTSWNVTQPINIYGNAGVIDVAKNLNAPLFVAGNLQTAILEGGGTTSVTVGGDLGSFEADFPGGPNFVGLLTAERVIGGFTLNDGGFSYTNDFATETQVVYNGSSNSLSVLSQPPVDRDSVDQDSVGQDSSFSLITNATHAAVGTQAVQAPAGNFTPSSLAYSIFSNNGVGAYSLGGASTQVAVAVNSHVNSNLAALQSFMTGVGITGRKSDIASVTTTVSNVSRLDDEGSIRLPLSKGEAANAAAKASRTSALRNKSVTVVDRLFSDPAKLAEQLEHGEPPAASVAVVPARENVLQPARTDEAPALRREVAALKAAVASFAPGGPWSGEGAADDELATAGAGRMTTALVATASALTAGFVLYESGSLLIVTAAASRLAHWKSLDPLAVLDYFEQHPVFSE